MIRSCFSSLPMRFFARAAAVAAVATFAFADRAMAQLSGTNYDFAVLLEPASTLNFTGTGNKIVGNVGFADTTSTSGGGTFNGGTATGTITGHQPGNTAITTGVVDSAALTSSVYYRRADDGYARHRPIGGASRG